MSTRGFRPRVDDAAGDLAAALDEAQRAVLALPDGASAAVLGAPGTGKTTALVEAIAERVHERGYAASEVLALSASRAAATALRDRISLRLGVPTPGPLARTATSLAFQLSGEQAKRNGGEPPRLLTGGEQDQIIAELLAGHLEDGSGPVWPPSLGPEVRILRGFRTELRELIGRCAERGVSPSRLAELGAITGRDEWRAAGRFIAEYQNVLDSFRGGYVDAAELIASAVPVVAEGSSLDGLRALFVDDLQEATVATIALLRAVAARGIAVIAFGDPDVASTTFRGAEVAALGQLGARLGVPVTRIVLSTAHRQTPALRELTSRVTERIGAAAAGVHRVAGAGQVQPEDTGPAVVVVKASSAPAEAARLARLLRERRLIDGVPWNRMAVVVRSGAHIPGLARSLAVAEVPTTTSIAGRPLRDDYAARQLITIAGVALGAIELTPSSPPSCCSGRSAVSTPSACAGCGSRCARRSWPATATARATTSWWRRWRRPRTSPRSTPRPPAGRPAWPRPCAAAGRRRRQGPPSRSCSGTPGSAADWRSAGWSSPSAPGSSPTRPTVISTASWPCSQRHGASSSARPSVRPPTS
ncbi:UvrD-helicase domain-containing protein [Streptomyces sp. L7]|uniref:UvrD-helicase domain-containing protein n=1 Tax=Streptomyces sp. L7 TaxID=3423954 RepID=UPI003D988053